jgi:hypothetical protein
MANPNPNTSGLDKPKWNNTPTVAIRIPQAFVGEIMQFSRDIDSGNHLILPSDCKSLNREIQRLETELEILQAENEKLRKQLSKSNNEDNSVHSNNLKTWYEETLPKLGTEKGYKSNSASQLIKDIKSIKSQTSSCFKPEQIIDIPSDI